MAGLIDTQRRFFLAGCSSEPEIRRSAVSQVWSDSWDTEGLLGKLNKSRAQLSRPALRQDGDLTVSAAAMGREGERVHVLGPWMGRHQCVMEETHADASSKLAAVPPCHWTTVSVVHHPLLVAGLSGLTQQRLVQLHTNEASTLAS